ncbi:MAG: UDP-glucose:(heptosyl)LPS alpha,3-glucosyltransferase [Chthoniobacter sp.]|jgi:UDP-glucose:(heptosyl)LPS alpha-1,3-glucosyltransferase|nr:UDP-glucose:(heptosyl)LPS alpha,3-glucosyltransferase [Chthoniobacter sp.]
MKIGLVRRGYSRTGGAEAYLLRFAETAVASGHEALLFSEQWPRDAWPWEHVQIHSRSPRQFADSLRARRANAACDCLFSLERVWGCDVYRAGDGVHAAWMERRAQFEPFWKPWLRRFNRKHLELLALERHLLGPEGAGLVIANSHLVKAEIERRFAFPAEGIRVVYNGVPPYSPAPDARLATRRELGLRTEDYVLLFAGSGWERKGLRFAMSAVNALPSSARLLVAGRGSTRGLPESRRTRFLGPVPEMARYYAAADAFVLPTLYDPFSNACLEALAAGLPVITTQHNGFAEIIQPGGQGEVVADPRDSMALVRAIEAWRDPARRTPLRPQLQGLGARFTLAANARQTLAIIAG